MSDSDQGGTSLKLALGRLLPSVKIRNQIERDAQTIQFLAVRGSLVATTAVLRSLQDGKDCPPVNDSTWWRNCISVCGYTNGGRNPEPTPQLSSLQAIAVELFGYETFRPPVNIISNSLHPPICCDYLWAHLSALVTEMQTACRNHVAKSFHRQLSKAFQREICCYLRESGAVLPPPLQRHIVCSSTRRCTGHQDAQQLPQECPGALSERLNVIINAWVAKFQSALPCPHPSFIENDTKMVKLASLVTWMYELQGHRIACVQRMAYLLPLHLPRPERCVESFFTQKSAKPQAILPRFSPEMRHIQINGSTLASMVNGLVSRGELPDGGRIRSKTASQDDFLVHFPGLRAFRRQSRYVDGDAFTFQSFRTDGVSASVFFKSKHQRADQRDRPDEAGPARKKRKTTTTTTPARAVPVPLDGKRVVGIDPGRTDMVYAVYGSNQAVEGRFAIPTADFRRRCHTDEAKRLGEKHLKSVMVGEGSLWSAMNSLPTARDISRWEDFLQAYLPIVTDIVFAKRARCLRRTRFDAHIRRDRVLDQVIKQIFGGSLKPAMRQSTHVGLGAAKVCSTGFGHASAPQGRLRFRLEKVHGVSVTMIDEFRTSQVCSTCRIARLYKAKVHGKKSWILEACPNCRNRTATGPRILHHDFHGAMNIRHIFLEQMAARPRPTCFTRGTDRLPNSPLAFHNFVPL